MKNLFMFKITENRNEGNLSRRKLQILLTFLSEVVQEIMRQLQIAVEL